MGKNIKKLSLSKSAVIGCLIAATALTSFGVRAYGEEKTSASNGTQISQTNNMNELLVDSRFKNYKDLEKASRVAGFNFKLPDYAVANYAADGGIVVRKINDSENYVTLYFANKDEDSDNYGYYLEMLKENPKDAYAKIYAQSKYSTADITSSKKSVGNIKGEDITIVETTKDNKDDQSMSKIFAWKDEGIYYTVTYSEQYKYDSEWRKLGGVNEEDLEKIVNSMKKREDITNVKYFEKSKYGDTVTEIYDTEDLENAAKDLGFMPKFIKNINNEMKINSAYVGKDEYDKLEIVMGYRDKDNNHIYLSEHKDAEEYNDMKNNKYLLYKFDENCKPSESEKITINNKEVYKIKEKVKEEYENASNEYAYIYMWEDNGIYYKADGTCQNAVADKKLESAISDIIKQL